jgi:hypothetical protein
MSEMGSHDSFGHLKHKLWPKERMGVKLAIWLLTTKSRESPRFPHVQVACDILLERFQRGLQLCFELHPNRRFERKIMDSHLGVLRQNVIWMWASWRATKYTIRGKVVASPKSGPWWILWVWVCSWLVLAPKIFKLCTN